MGIAAIWIICGIAAGVVGASKGRSGLGWFFLGVLLGPLALLMVGFMPRLSDDHSEPTRKCPHCAETIKSAAKVCKHCGRDVVQPATAPQVPGLAWKDVPRIYTRSGPDKKACPSCKTYNDIDAEDCSSCGWKPGR